MTNVDWNQNKFNEAIRTTNLDPIQNYIQREGVDIEKCGMGEITPLQYCCALVGCRKPGPLITSKVIRVLLDHGANRNAVFPTFLSEIKDEKLRKILIPHVGKTPIEVIRGKLESTPIDTKPNLHSRLQKVLNLLQQES